MGAYVDAETTEATNTVKSSFHMQIIGYKFQNPGTQ